MGVGVGEGRGEGWRSRGREYETKGFGAENVRNFGQDEHQGLSGFFYIFSTSKIPANVFGQYVLCWT